MFFPEPEPEYSRHDLTAPMRDLLEAVVKHNVLDAADVMALGMSAAQLGMPAVREYLVTCAAARFAHNMYGEEGRKAYKEIVTLGDALAAHERATAAATITTTPTL